ncbi:MAG: hypothetical protein FWD66_09910 [Paludibacter sp.]|nr:hypothetical protein [Paludibacter sp.]
MATIGIRLDKSSCEGNEKSVKQLNELLSHLGIEVSIHEDTMLYFDFDKQITKKKITRLAGRKEMISDLTLSEVLKLRETSDDKEIYSKLNLSKSTFYRRLKFHENRHSQPDDHF